MGLMCSSSQINKREQKQIQTDQIIVEMMSNNFNNLNIVIELIQDISIFDMAIYQQTILILQVEEQIKIEVNQDIEQQNGKSISEESHHSLFQSKNPPPSITLENEQEPYSQLLQSMIVKKKEKLQAIQQDIVMLDYSPIRQESKSQISIIINSLEPFSLDFESSSSSQSIQWNQEYSVDSNGEILVTGIVN